METLTQQFQSRVTGFLERTGLKPSMFGLRTTGDPNLMRQLRRGRSPTLKLADRVLAFIDSHDQVHEDHVASRSRPLEDASLRDRRDRAVAKAIEQEMDVPVRLIPLPGVEARTGQSPSTIYLRVAEGSFPKPVCVVGWIEEDVDAWIRQQPPASRGEAQ